MIPDVPTVLGGIARSLMLDIGVDGKTPYQAQTIQLLSALLMMIQQEFDRAAARLVEENDALVALFRDAESIVGDAPLREALRTAVATPPTTLLVSALRERNGTLRSLLIRLHTHVEDLHDAAAHALEERIWAELAASTQRRQLDLANG
jgi:hypothetical protein